MRVGPVLCDRVVLVLPGVLQLGPVGHEPVVMPPRNCRRWNAEDGATEGHVSSGDRLDDRHIVDWTRERRRRWRLWRRRRRRGVFPRDVTSLLRRRRLFHREVWGRRGERESDGVGGRREGGGSDLRQTSQLVEVERSEGPILKRKESEWAREKEREKVREWEEEKELNRVREWVRESDGLREKESEGIREKESERAILSMCGAYSHRRIPWTDD